MKTGYLIPILLAFFISSTIYGQKLNYEISDNASKMFNMENYWRAKELYREQYKKDLSNTKNKYHFGVCLVYTYERKDAIKILESIANKPETPIEVWYHLARAYHLSDDFEKAITLYKKYSNINGAKAALVINCSRNTEMCNNAKSLLKNPLNLSFENLGKRINSKGKEYLPMMFPDENFLFYTTRRQGTTGRIYDLEGYYTSDIFLGKYKYGKWSKARSVGPPNSYGNEQTAGISEDGKFVIYYVDNPNSKNNLQISEKKKSSYRKAIQIKEKHINSKEGRQLSATISNKQDYLIFSSDRIDGIGKQDLYSCKKLPSGEWSQPTSLGNSINTQYNECYPYLSNNGKVLYFSSEGHNSIGGFDIFKSIYDSTSNSWSKPTNIGYPLNTAADDMSICFSKNKKYAYIATHREDSHGDLDIYRVNFLDIDASYTLVKGYVLDMDSNVVAQHLQIKVFDKATGSLQGIYKTRKKKGSYVMILPPGLYDLQIEIPKVGIHKESFEVKGRNLYREEINKNIKVVLDSPETEIEEN